MIIITGASDGLGKEIAKVLVADGKTVVSLSRQQADAATKTIQTDLTDVQSIENAAQALLAEDEKIEALINCAGIMSLQPLDKITADEVAKVFAVHVTGPMLFVSKLTNRLKQDGTDIINVASTVGLKAYEDQAAYGSSKWAMRGFSQNLQLEFKNTQNRVISFCVGGFLSDIREKATGELIPDPQNWMKPEDIARFMKQILELPKNMEVSEIIINRKLPA